MGTDFSFNFLLVGLSRFHGDIGHYMQRGYIMGFRICRNAGDSNSDNICLARKNMCLHYLHAIRKNKALRDIFLFYCGRGYYLTA